MFLKRMKSAGLVGALAGLALSAAPAVAGGAKGGYASAPPAYDTKAWVLFSGFDAVEDAAYAFQGVIYSFNRDISRDGFVLRVYGSHVDYEYDNGGVRTDGDGWQGDVMIGYKFNRGHWWAAGYIGVDYQDHDLTPDDPDNPVRGTEWGFKVAADIATLRHGSPLYFGLSGQYSTAFDSYWARARVGINRDHYTFGPEGIVMGSDSFDAQRVGGFLTFDLNLAPRMPIEVTLSGGYQFIDDDNNGGGGFGSGGGEGVYGGIVFVTVF